ncbi:hypothetical protein ACTHGU_02355 [Chitinophagaceae bacterium MMS25-I14]
MTKKLRYIIIQNNYEGSNNNGPINNQGTQIINPVEKWLEALEENKKLYERMLKEKDEMIATLKELVKK